MKFKIQNSRFKKRQVHWCTGAHVHKKIFPIFHFPFSIILILFIFQISCSDPRVPPPSASPEPVEGRPRVETELAQPTRIVSLAPSITEVLFKLGLGDRVAGVTRYCDYPPEAEDKPKVGGYFDVNYEMLLSLESDLVILLVEHQDALVRLEELSIRTLAVNHSRVTGILDSITTIAERSGVHDKGAALRRDLENRIQEVQDGLFSMSPRPRVPVSDSSPPRILVAVGRLMDKGSGGDIFISGRDGFYDDLITLAGGVNAYREETLKFPAISNEGLVRLDPDVILEMVPDLAGDTDRESLMALWHAKFGIRAVREGRVHILGEDYVVIPGPRFVDLLEDMAVIINKESGGKWKVESGKLKTEN
jgi:iron complex transport system substrate-binding protein